MWGIWLQAVFLRSTGHSAAQPAAPWPASPPAPPAILAAQRCAAATCTSRCGWPLATRSRSPLPRERMAPTTAFQVGAAGGPATLLVRIKSNFAASSPALCLQLPQCAVNYDEFVEDASVGDMLLVVREWGASQCASGAPVLLGTSSGSAAHTSAAAAPGGLLSSAIEAPASRADGANAALPNPRRTEG